MITSHDNSKLKLVRKLAEKRWREKEGAFVTEGEDLLAAGLAAGAKPIAVLVDPDSEIEGEEVEPALLAGVSSLGSGTRVIAIWPIGDRALGAEGLWVYLHGVGDPGNVGAIARSAHALGGSGVICGPGTADPYGPKAVRATMGSVFALPLLKAQIGQAPVPRLALVASGGVGLADAAPALAGGGTICLGAERDGLPADVVGECEITATIPIAAGVDSLNVAAAAAIALERIHSAAVEEGSTPGATHA